MTIGALDRRGRRAEGHRLALARAADLLPDPLRREDQVRADGHPVRAAGPARRAAADRRARDVDRCSRASCGPATCLVHGEGGEPILDGLSFSIEPAQPPRDRRPGRQRQGGADAGAGRPARADRGPGDASAVCDLLSAAGGGARPADRLCRQPDHDLRRHDRGQPALRPEVPPAAAAARRARTRCRAYEREMHEAKRSGNSPHDPQADWVDYDGRRHRGAGGAA